MIWATSVRTWSSTPHHLASRIRTDLGQIGAGAANQYGQIQLPTPSNWSNPQNGSYAASRLRLRNCPGCSSWQVPPLFAGNFLSDMHERHGLGHKCVFANTRPRQTTIEEYRERRPRFPRAFLLPESSYSLPSVQRVRECRAYLLKELYHGVRSILLLQKVGMEMKKPW